MNRQYRDTAGKVHFINGIIRGDIDFALLYSGL